MQLILIRSNVHINEFSPFSDVFLLSVKNFKLQRKRFGSNSMHFVKAERGGGGEGGRETEPERDRIKLRLPATSSVDKSNSTLQHM